MRGITRISVLTFLIVVSVSLTVVLRDTMEAQRVPRADRLVFQAGPEAVKALLATDGFSSMDHLVIAGVDKKGPVAKDIKAQSFYTKLVYNKKIFDESGSQQLKPRFSAIFAPASKPDKTPVNMFPIVNVTIQHSCVFGKPSRGLSEKAFHASRSGESRIKVHKSGEDTYVPKRKLVA